jgi:hypothetical protein
MTSAFEQKLDRGQRPERPEFTACAARLAMRPALQRSEAKDKELAGP